MADDEGRQEGEGNTREWFYGKNISDWFCLTGYYQRHYQPGMSEKKGNIGNKGGRERERVRGGRQIDRKSEREKEESDITREKQQRPTSTSRPSWPVLAVRKHSATLPVRNYMSASCDRDAGQ